MRYDKAIIVAVLAILVAPLWAEGQGKQPGGPAVRIEKRAIVVEGVKPGRELLLFGVWHQPIPHSTHIRRWDKVAADDDRDGIVTFTFDSDIPFRSVWAVVDLHGDEYVVAGPEGFDLRSRPLPGSALKKNGEDVEAIELEAYSTNVLVVRGGAGAWLLNSRQGDPATDDLPDDGNVIRIDPGKLKPVTGNAPPPKVLTPGDLILVIEPYELDLHFARVGR